MWEMTSAKNCANIFLISNYVDSCGRNQKCYELTRDGFSLLVKGLTGKKALEWKLKYIESFNIRGNKLRNNPSTINIEELSSRRSVQRGIEEAQEPSSKTYRLDLDKGRISGKIDGLEAVNQAIRKAIITPRFKCLIYDNQYGSEVEDAVISILKQQLRDSLPTLSSLTQEYSAFLIFQLLSMVIRHIYHSRQIRYLERPQ